MHRRFSYRKISGYPFIVAVGLTDSDVFAQWHRNVWIFGAIVVLFVAVACTLILRSVRYASAQRRLEHAVAAAETARATAYERLETVFQHSSDSMLIARAQGPNDIVYEAVNPIWEKISGVSASQAIGRTPHDCLPPELADLVDARWHECLRNRVDQSFPFRSPDGREWEANLVPLFDSSGQADRLIATARDITERNGLMRTLEQLNGKLEELNRELEVRVQKAVEDREEAFVRASMAERMQALGQLAGGIAHDFNNVLQSVLGCATLIKRRSSDPTACERMATIAEQAAERGASITQRLLAFSRLQELQTQVIDVQELIGNLSELLSHSLGASILIRNEVDPAVASVLADKGQLETVLLNLATNARDAMPAGGILTLAAVSETVSNNSIIGLSGDRYVKFSVGDTGSGMDRATLARVMEPFFTTKPIGKGTGLGLSMAKGFAGQSHGALTIDSEPGLGTTVTLWLPEADQHAHAVVAPTRDRCRLQARRTRILLVDDDAAVRETLAEQLGETFDVLCAANGQEALSQLGRDAGFDLIVTDLTMPGMDGLSLIREAQLRQPKLLAILLTGYAGDLAPLTATSAVADSLSIVRKPVIGTELGDLIDALMASALDFGEDTSGSRVPLFSCVPTDGA